MKRITLLLFISVFIFSIFSCKKENVPEIIGKSVELSAYEKFMEDVNSGRIDSSALIYTDDGGSLYYGYFDREYYNTLDNITYVHLDVLISMIDKNGNLAWQYTCGDEKTGGDIGEIIQNDDKNLIFPKERVSLNSELNRQNYLVCLNTDGNLLWEKEHPNNCRYSYKTQICQTNDDGFMILANIDSIESIIYNEEYGYIEDMIIEKDCNLIKTDANGNIQWQKRFGEHGIDEQSGAIIQREDGAYIVSVTKTSEVADYTKIYILDEFGNTTYENTKPFVFRESSMIKANDGGYLLGGVTINIYNEKEEFILTKLDESGRFDWINISPLSTSDLRKKDEQYGVFKNFKIINLLNTAYFCVYQRYNETFVSKFNNSGELIN